MQHHEDEDMMPLQRLELYTVRNANRGVHTSVALRDQNTRVYTMLRGRQAVSQQGLMLLCLNADFQSVFPSRVVGINSRCCGRGCSCILLLIRSYFLSCLGYTSVFVGAGMGAQTQCTTIILISYQWE